MKSLSQRKLKAESEPKMTLKRLAEKVITKSKEGKDSGRDRRKRLHQRRKEYDAKVADLKREHQEEMAHLKKEYGTNLFKLRDLCLEKDKDIASYWQELQQYVRLPNALEGKFIPSGKTSSEGHLFSTKKDGEAHRYPIFYYQSD
jgi:hypothetical protein